MNPLNSSSNCVTATICGCDHLDLSVFLYILSVFSKKPLDLATVLMYTYYVINVYMRCIKMSIPESIKKQKPTLFGAVEIRCFGEGKYYVYLISSKWNPDKNRPQKVTGKSIGKITESDGFIPNANGLRLMKEMRVTPDTAPVVKNYGAYELLQQLTPNLNSRLRECFPDIFREIRTISLIRLVDSVSSAKMIQPMFLDSYLSDVCSDVSVSEGSVRRFVSYLGSIQEQLDYFMRLTGHRSFQDPQIQFRQRDTIRSTVRIHRQEYCMYSKKTPTSRYFTVWCRDQLLTKPLLWILLMPPAAVTVL